MLLMCGDVQNKAVFEGLHAAVRCSRCRHQPISHKDPIRDPNSNILHFLLNL